MERDFGRSAQIAVTTITFIQYNILSLVKRFHCYETISELFEQAVLEHFFDVLIKKVLKNFASKKKLRTFAPAKTKTLHP